MYFEHFETVPQADDKNKIDALKVTTNKTTTTQHTETQPAVINSVDTPPATHNLPSSPKNNVPVYPATNIPTPNNVQPTTMNNMNNVQPINMNNVQPINMNNVPPTNTNNMNGYGIPNVSSDYVFNSVKEHKNKNNCNTSVIQVQEDKIMKSFGNIQKILSSTNATDDIYHVIAKNDTLRKEVISMLASINGVADNQDFMTCMFKGIASENREVCDQISGMIRYNDKDAVLDIMDRYSFLIPTILLISLKFAKQALVGCGHTTTEIDSLYNKILSALEKTGLYMQFDKLDKELKRIDIATGKIVQAETFSGGSIIQDVESGGRYVMKEVDRGVRGTENFMYRYKQVILVLVAILLIYLVIKHGAKFE